MEPFVIPNPVEGVIRSAAWEDSISEVASAQDSVNFHYDRMGSSTVRSGVENYLQALPDVPISLGTWNQNASSNSALLAQVEDGSDTEIYFNTGSGWTLGRSLTGNNRVRYAQFLNYTYTINGASGATPETFDGATFGTTNVDSLPAGDYIEIHDGRVWIGNAAQDKIYYSNVPSSSGVITGGTDFVYKISPQDGEELKGLKSHPRALLAFKQNHIYRIYGPTAADAYPAYFRGTYSQESILSSKEGLFFHHPSGFYKFQYDGQPQEISKKVIDFVEAIPTSRYDNIFGWTDDDHLYWWIGDVTIKGRTYRQCVLRYTLSTQVWTVFEYFASSTKELRCAITYGTTGADIRRLVGVYIPSASSRVAQVNIGTTDLGEPIFYDEISRWYAITKLESMLKRIDGLAATSIGGAGANLSVQTDLDDANRWIKIGSYRQDYVTLFTTSAIPSFNRIRFRKSGTSTGTPPIFNTIEIIKWIIEGYRDN